MKRSGYRYLITISELEPCKYKEFKAILSNAEANILMTYDINHDTETYTLNIYCDKMVMTADSKSIVKIIIANDCILKLSTNDFITIQLY